MILFLCSMSSHGLEENDHNRLTSVSSSTSDSGGGHTPTHQVTPMQMHCSFRPVRDSLDTNSLCTTRTDSECSDMTETTDISDTCEDAHTFTQTTPPTYTQTATYTNTTTLNRHPQS